MVENGVWVRQEPVFDSPINLGAHCAKGAALREHGHGEYRLRYPMKLVNGKYERISWDTALDEITAKLKEQYAKLNQATGTTTYRQQTGLRQVVHVAAVQDVEDAVGEHQRAWPRRVSHLGRAQDLAGFDWRHNARKFRSTTVEERS